MRRKAFKDVFKTHLNIYDKAFLRKCTSGFKHYKKTSKDANQR